jgi:sugar/nucleoside kinase (ribokinase family)
MRFDYVTVGHVTADILLDRPSGAAAVEGLRQPGGGAFYSALQAARLGLRTLIVTQGAPQQLEELLEPYRPELEVRIVPAEHTTTLHTRGAGHARTQRLTAWAGAIELPMALDTAILHLAPIARETPRDWRGRVDFVGLTPQGLLRAWDAHGTISAARASLELLPERCDAMVLSREEWESCGEPLRRAPAHGTAVAVTAGSQPTTIELPGAGGKPLEAPASPIAHPRDDLGAGDVFAAAFFVALHSGLPPAQAAAFGNAAAAVRIAGDGPAAIGDRTAIEAQLPVAVQPAADRRS